MRYLNDDGRAIEAFVGLEKLATTDAAALLVDTKRVLCEKIGLKISQMVAVGFDGGSQYRGKNAGLQAKLRTESPNLLYVWCNNHKLQLSCVYATKSTPAIKRMVDGLVSLAIFFNYSPKRMQQMKAAAELLELPHLKPVIPGDTRWCSLQYTSERLIANYQQVLLALENIASIETGKVQAEANGYYTFLLNFENLILLRVFNAILLPVQILNKGLQASALGAIDAVKQSKATITQLKSTDVCSIFVDARTQRQDIEEKLSANFAYKCFSVGSCPEEILSEKLFKETKRYISTLVESMQEQLVDSIAPLAELLPKLSKKETIINWVAGCRAVGLCEDFALRQSTDGIDMATEWRMYNRRMDPTDLAKLACNDSEKAMFESLSRVAVHVNLLPFSSSPAERSVSTMNRVMMELRTCLTDDHLDDLMCGRTCNS